MKRKLIVGLVGIAILGTLLTGCTEGAKRNMKSMGSNLNGGLNRKVTAYTNDGVKIGEWKGKFDVTASSDGEIMFEYNGKRVILYNATIVNEEQ